MKKIGFVEDMGTQKDWAQTRGEDREIHERPVKPRGDCSPLMRELPRGRTSTQTIKTMAVVDSSKARREKKKRTSSTVITRTRTNGGEVTTTRSTKLHNAQGQKSWGLVN